MRRPSASRRCGRPTGTSRCRPSLSGVGLLLSLALGLWMARRPKMPFVLVPGFLSCAACLAMAFTPGPPGVPVPAGALQPVRDDHPAGDDRRHPRELPGGSPGGGDGPTPAVVRGGLPRRRDGHRASSSTRPAHGGSIQALLVATAVLHTAAYLAFSRIRVPIDAIEDEDGSTSMPSPAAPTRRASRPPTGRWPRRSAATPGSSAIWSAASSSGSAR